MADYGADDQAEDDMNKTMRFAAFALTATLMLGMSHVASAQQAGNTTFFVTSAGSGKGADLGGLAGADRICQQLAQAVGAGDERPVGPVLRLTTDGAAEVSIPGGKAAVPQLVSLRRVGVAVPAVPRGPALLTTTGDRVPGRLTGGEDLRGDESQWEVLSSPEAHESVLEAIQKANIPTMSASVAMVPKNLIKLEGKSAQGMLRMYEALEDHDDVQNVYSNFDIDEKDLEALAS